MRKLHEQVVVIIGASSGIGRETALAFGRHGASVVLAARNEEALNEVALEIDRLGGKARVVVTDVAEWPQVERLGHEAVTHFGRIDTWINCAAISTYATVEEMTIEEIDRVIQVTLMGLIHGVKAALPHMKRQGQGNIINVASVLGQRSVPLQSAYCAAKHGVIGFTDSLRIELQHQNSGIHVTSILPSSINTPLFTHARSKLGVKPKPIPPIYQPHVVAEAILFCAEHPRREIVVGGGKILTILERISPPLTDWYMLKSDMVKQQQTDEPDNGQDNLFAPMQQPSSTTGTFGAQALAASPYTRFLELHPTRQRVLLVALAGGLIAFIRRIGR